jgi:acyl carrier protein
MMQRPDQERISFEEFRRIIARELQIDESQVVGDASFVEDLMADSIKLVEMMLRMEEIGMHIGFIQSMRLRRPDCISVMCFVNTSRTRM